MHHRISTHHQIYGSAPPSTTMQHRQLPSDSMHNLHLFKRLCERVSVYVYVCVEGNTHARSQMEGLAVWCCGCGLLVCTWCMCQPYIPYIFPKCFCTCIIISTTDWQYHPPLINTSFQHLIHVHSSRHIQLITSPSQSLSPNWCQSYLRNGQLVSMKRRMLIVLYANIINNCYLPLFNCTTLIQSL